MAFTMQIAAYGKAAEISAISVRMRECHPSIVTHFGLVIEKLTDEIQLQQCGFAVARAGSWMLISSACFGQHGLSTGDLNFGFQSSESHVNQGEAELRKQCAVKPTGQIPEWQHTFGLQQLQAVSHTLIS